MPQHLLRSSPEGSSQVYRLRSQLDAQITRTSLLQRRLNDTLATLDALVQSHAEELAIVTRSEKRLRNRLNEYVQYAKDLEAQRDGLRSEITQLIQQALLSNGTLPCTQIHLTHPLDPLPRPPSPTFRQPDEEFARLTAVSLREQLEEERRNHANDLENANQEILTLRAQLARREAELEACIYHTGADRDVWHSPPRTEEAPSSARESPRNHDANRRIPISSLTREEMVQIFGIADVRNRSLERELYTMSESIQTLRDRDPSRSPRLSTTPRAGSSKSRRIPQSSSYPPTPRLSTLREGPNPQPLLQQFRSQLQRFEDAIDTFVVERKQLRTLFEEQSIHLNEHVSNVSLSIAHREPSPQVPSSPITVHVPSSLSPVSTPLPSIPSSSRPLSRSSTPQQRISDILSDDDTIQSMELATPLQPTVLLPDLAGNSEPEHEGDVTIRPPPQVDPSLIPLPASPNLDEINRHGEDFRPDDSGVSVSDSPDPVLIDLNTPPRSDRVDHATPESPLQSPLHPSRTQVPIPQEIWLERAALIERLNQLERGIAAAREELERKSQELQEMRCVMEGLDVQFSVR